MMVDMVKVNDIHGMMYSGDNGDWYLAMAYAEAGNLIDKANFEALVNQLEDRADPDDWTRESFNGWFGWGEHLMVRPDSEAYRVARAANQYLRDEYHVLNEELLWDMEYEIQLENTRCALQEYGYPATEAIAWQVYDVCQFDPPFDDDSPGYRDPEDFYPSKAACFLGYLHYRREMKKN